MAMRAFLHKNHLEDFKTYLDSQLIAYRPGKGEGQELQVLTPNDGWQVIHRRAKMPEHFSIADKLYPIVRNFIDKR